MGTATIEPTVHLTSPTLAEIHHAGDVDHVYASTNETLRARIVESIRQLAASTGEPVTATMVDGESRWPLIVHPDGTFIEAPSFAHSADATTAMPVITGVPQPVAGVAAPGAEMVGAPVEADSVASAPAPADPVEISPVAPAEPAAEPEVPVTRLRSDAPRGETRTEGRSDARGENRSESRRSAPTVDDLLNSRAERSKPRANEGWQAVVRRATGGLISPPPGKAEASRLDRERTVQRRLDAPRTIVILNPKGGAHKTTSTLLLAATFGTQRGGATLAWDNNETRGTLGWRAQNAPHSRTAVDLLEDLDRFTDASQASLASLDTYVRTQVDARFDVLASDEDAAASSTIDAAAFDRLHSVLARYYRLLIVDTGNNMRASNWVAAVAAADQLVIVSTVREDTAASAAWLLDGLREKGFDRKIDEAVTILTAPSARPDKKLADRLERHFEQVTGSVVHVPFDPALVDGGPIDFDALAPETRDAWLTAAAAIAVRL